MRRVGARIRELRREHGLTQEAFAERVGMLAPNYARLEQGRSNPTVSTLLRVADGLGVALDRLFEEPKSLAARPGRPRQRDRD
jgi:transcriptional regulator with XRE-family HTH domain